MAAILLETLEGLPQADWKGIAGGTPAPSFLFRAQCFHRLNARGAACGQVGGQYTHDQHHHAAYRQEPSILRGHARETPQYSSQGEA